MNDKLKELMLLTESLPPEYSQRLKKELNVIIENEYDDLMPYFITLADIFKFARENNIPAGCGRGSSSGSLISYLLGITKLDPIKYNLPFSRFLSNARLKRGSLPDIDCDWPTTKRDLINNYIFNKYGDRAAHVATFTMLKLKNALMDCFRVFVIQPQEHQIRQLKESGKLQESISLKYKLDIKIKRFTDVRKGLGNPPVGIQDIEWLHGYKLDDAVYPGLLESNPTFKQWCEEHPEVLEAVERVLGLPRNVSSHAGGVVISPISLNKICPVMKVDGLNVIVYDKKTIQKIGLIKYDNLGLTTLDYIDGCIELLKKRNINIDLDELPDDPSIYDIYMDGRCLSIFQWSTQGGAAYIKKMKPLCLKDVIIGVALNRPGATDAIVKLSDGSEMAASLAYIERKDGNSKVEYIHPDLKPYLEETLGIFVFQETVQSVLQGLLGFDEEEADEIRSHISDKNPQAFQIVKDRLPILINKGWTSQQADHLYETILAFSRYSFNCLDGEQLVRTSKGGVSIKEVVENINKHEVAYLNDDNSIKYEKPIFGKFMGIKEVWEVELEDGTVIKATPDHRFWCNGEWVELRHLCENNYIEIV